MALVVKDRVKVYSSTTGTGTLSLGSAFAGFQTFNNALGDGDTTYYGIFESSTGEWEVGLGTYTSSGNTLSRDTILESSNAGAAVNLTADTEVFITYPADKSVYFDANGDVNLNRDPQSALQAATKQYVDTIAAAGIHYHDPVRVESPDTAGNLTATYDNGSSGVGATLTNSGTQAALVIDGVTVSTNDRVLIYSQTNGYENGVYTVTNTGSASTNWVLTRATDADSYGPSDPDSLGQGDAFFVKEGDTGAGELYVMNTAGEIVFGTTDINFIVVAETAVYSAGDGLTLSGTEFNVGPGTGITVNATTVSTVQDIATSATPTFDGLTTTGNITFGDNDKAIFGAGSDLQIYHDGSDSYISDVGTGDLKIQGANVRLENPSGVRYFQGSSGISYLYNSGDIKLATTSTGVDITGTLTSDGLTVYNGTSDPDVLLRNNGTGDVTLTFRRGAADDVYTDWSLINDNGTFTFRSDNSSDPDHTQLTMSQGDISFYEDTGTTAKFFWDASAESLGIGTSSPSEKLDVLAGLARFANNTTPANEADGAAYFGKISGTAFMSNQGGVTFRTASTEAMRIDSSGRVGIGTSSPDALLNLSSDSASDGAVLRLENSRTSMFGGDKYGQLQFFGNDSSTTASGIRAYINTLSTGGNGEAHMTFGTAAPNSAVAEAMRIDSSGNVGIGTSSPTSKLEVNVNGTSAITVRSSDGGQANLIFGDQADADRGRVVYSNADESMRFAVNNLVEAMRIDSSGNVGIGTSSPSSHLHVKSTSDNIVATRVSTNSVDALFQSIESASLAQIGTTGAHAFTFFTSNQERMRIDSSGNVGIGLTSAGNKLEILGSVVSKALNTDTGFLVGENGSAALLRQYENRPMLFYTNNTERMRIDSSGNLLVGTTDTTLYNNSDGSEGVRIAEDHVSIASDARTVFYVNRQTSDGEIINIRKDGTTVGSIGTSGGVAQYSGASYASFGAGDVGFFANPASDALYPVVQTTLAGRDAAIDLGLTTNRFKDLYLSGGVFLGGTGAANKLDDYEEGSWTPVIKVGTTTNSGTLGNARYIKIGGMVTVYLEVYSITKSGTGNLEIEGLPYACGANSRYGAPFATRYAGIGGGFPVPLIQASTSVLQVQRFDTGSNGYAGAVTDSQLDSTYSLYSMGMTYFTS